MAIARAMGRSLRETLEYLGDELPLWEAEYSISPWGPERPGPERLEGGLGGLPGPQPQAAGL